MNQISNAGLLKMCVFDTELNPYRSPKYFTNEDECIEAAKKIASEMYLSKKCIVEIYEILSNGKLKLIKESEILL